jgi:hypothetical protein
MMPTRWARMTQTASASAWLTKTAMRTTWAKRTLMQRAMRTVKERATSTRWGTAKQSRLAWLCVTVMASEWS